MSIGAPAGVLPQGTREGEEYPLPIRFEWRLMAELRQVNPGISITEIAQSLGRSYQAVHSWTRNPHYIRYENWRLKKVVDEIQLKVPDAKGVQETFQTHAADMQQRLLDILDETRDPKLQTAIIHDWLDRSGHQSRKREERGTVVVLSAEAVQALVNRAHEANLPIPIEAELAEVKEQP